MNSLLLDVGAQFEYVLLAGHLELVREAKVLHLDLRMRMRNGRLTIVVLERKRERVIDRRTSWKCVTPTVHFSFISFWCLLATRHSIRSPVSI